MKLRDAARLSGMTLARKPETVPEPDPSTPVTVVHDQRRVIETITLAELPAYQAMGFRELAPGTAAVVNGEAISEAESAPEDRSLFAAMKNTTAGQAGQWAAREALARQALDTAADALAARIGRPRIERTMRRQEPHPVRADDVAQTAIVAEAVVSLARAVDTLAVRLAALEAAREK